MITYAAAFIVATLLAAILTPIVRTLALRLGAVSQVGGRNVNTIAIPRLGGVAIALASTIPIAVLFVVRSEVARYVRNDAQLAAGLAAGSLALCLCGAIDDVNPLRARTKLLAQVFCAATAYFSGFQITMVAVPFLGALDMGVFALPVTVLWIVGITNAVNLIDGLDGLAAGVVFCAAATNLVVAVVNGAVFVAVVMAALMGSLFGFLFYNFNPARIFMGDSGSYFLGYVIATASLAGNLKASAAVSLIVPVLALGLPIFDTLFSILRRAAEKKPLFSPDRGHIHHRLLDLGLTHRRAVLTLYVLSATFAVSALAVSLGRDWQTGAALLIAVALVAGLVRVAGMMNVRFNSQTPTDSRFSAELGRLLFELPRTGTPEEVMLLVKSSASLFQVEEIELIQRGIEPCPPSNMSDGFLVNAAGTTALKIRFFESGQPPAVFWNGLVTLVEVAGIAIHSTEQSPLSDQRGAVSQ